MWLVPAHPKYTAILLSQCSMRYRNYFDKFSTRCWHWPIMLYCKLVFSDRVPRNVATAWSNTSVCCRAAAGRPQTELINAPAGRKHRKHARISLVSTTQCSAGAASDPVRCQADALLRLRRCPTPATAFADRLSSWFCLCLSWFYPFLLREGSAKNSK